MFSDPVVAGFLSWCYFKEMHLSEQVDSPHHNFPTHEARIGRFSMRRARIPQSLQFQLEAENPQLFAALQMYEDPSSGLVGTGYKRLRGLISD